MDCQNKTSRNSKKSVFVMFANKNSKENSISHSLF